MRTHTHNMIALALEGDETLSAADREAILAFCREPWQKPLPPPETMPANPLQSSEAERFLLIGEAAELLRVSSRSIQRLIRSGRLSSHKVG